MSSICRKFLISIVVLLALSFIYVIIILFSPPGILLDIEPKSHNVSLPASFCGPFKENNILSKSEKLFENAIHGPESVAIFNDTVFTSSRDGYIYRIDEHNNKLIPVIKIINKTCETWDQHLCSRPLGIRFDTNGHMYVTEPYFGIFVVKHIMSGKPIAEPILMYTETEGLGKKSKFFDDLTIDENSGHNGGHVIYITEMSTKFDLSEMIIAAADASQTGRILRYDIMAKKLDIVLDHILCPNGIELSDTKESLLFAETITRRISKHYIKGPKSGLTERVLSGLPGEPDNIRKTTRNTYWIAIASARTQQNPLLMDWTEDKPWIRKLLLRSLHLFGSIVQWIGTVLESDSIKNVGFSMKTSLSDFFVGKLLQHSHGLALEVTESGDVIRSIHSPDGYISLLSEVNEVKRDNQTILYLGSFYNTFVGKLIID